MEQGLKLGGLHVDESGALLRLYLNTGNPRHDAAKAHDFAWHTIDSLPADPAPRAEFAQIIENAKLPTEALAAWRSALIAQPDVERAHVRVARLLLDLGNSKASEESATESLRLLPKSADLYLIEAEAIELQGRATGSRRVLEEGASATGAPVVLSRLAMVQDLFGLGAAEAYGKLADVLEKGSPQRLDALQRGFTVALRDGQLPQATVLSASLEAEGHSESRSILAGIRNPDSESILPGGRNALAFMARSKRNVPPDKFFAEYARALIANACAPNCGGNDYGAGIERYFDQIAALESLGKRVGNRVDISLSMNGKEERRRTEKVLHLMGLEVHSEKGALRGSGANSKGEWVT